MAVVGAKAVCPWAVFEARQAAGAVEVKDGASGQVVAAAESSKLIQAQSLASPGTHRSLQNQHTQLYNQAC